MRTVVAIAMISVLVGCAASLGNVGVVTYYDRNGDGVVDLEFHNLGCCDRDWALVDSDFNGRYDKRVQWGYALVKTPADLPVPKNVPITSGQPPLSGWSE
jgi:hypothetical protein